MYNPWRNVLTLAFSPLSGGQERYEELIQQEKAMTAFMDSFPTSRAGKLAELEAMQMAGTARQNPFGRTSNPDVAPLAFDESQARAMWSPCGACIMKS
jgi:hypothetical protein